MHFLLYPILLLVRFSPYLILHSIALGLAFIRFRLGKKERIRAAQNIERVFGYAPSSKKSNRLIYQAYYHSAMVLFETIKESLCPGTVRWTGEGEAQKAIRELEEGEGGQIIITGHVGNWEFVGLQIAKHSHKNFYALAKPSRFIAAQKLLQTMREKMGMQVLWTAGTGYFKTMLRALTAGHWLGFVMDQKPLQKNGITVDFLGQKTLFVTGPTQMAIRNKLPVLALFCLREGAFRYRIITKALFERGDVMGTELEITQKLAQIISDVIYAVPDQWVWEYRRW